MRTASNRMVYAVHAGEDGGLADVHSVPSLVVLCFDVGADVLFAQFVKSRFESLRASEFAVVLQEVVADSFSDIRAGEDVVESACWKYQFRQVLGVSSSEEAVSSGAAGAAASGEA